MPGNWQIYIYIYIYIFEKISQTGTYCHYKTLKTSTYNILLYFYLIDQFCCCYWCLFGVITKRFDSYIHTYTFNKWGKFPRDGTTINFVVYGQKETLFKRRHTNFQPKATISLRLAGIRTKCSRKNRERAIPCSDKTFLFKEVDGCAKQSQVRCSSRGHWTNVEDRLLLD